MNYLIVRSQENYLDVEKYPLDQDVLDRYFSSRQILIHALDMENIYDQVVEAHWDFKNKLDYWRMRSVSNPVADYIFNHEVRSSLNRLAFNLLNLTKLFIDRHFHKKNKKSHVLNVTASEALHEEVGYHCSKIYDSNINYEVGYKLRNMSQHRILPVTSFSTEMRYSHHSGEKLVGFRIKLSYEELLELDVRKFRIEESMTLDLAEVLDGYIYGISQLQERNRSLTLPFVVDAINFIESFGAGTPASKKYKTYYCEIEREQKENIYVDLEWFEVFHFLNKKHSFPIDYSSFDFMK